jgi:hypothetical protein
MNDTYIDTHNPMFQLIKISAHTPPKRYKSGKEAEDHNEKFKKVFQEKMRTSKCFATDGSKIENKPLVGFASIDTNDGRSRKFWMTKIASTFTTEALATGKTPEIIEKIDSEQNFMIF